MEKKCTRCDGVMQAGVTTALGLRAGNLQDGPARLVFVVRGEITSPNLGEAFQQGLEDRPWHQGYRIEGYRCSRCGALDLYAMEETTY